MQKFNSRIYLMIAAVICSLWLCSCAPEPDTNLIPVIKAIKADVAEDECKLYAELSEEPVAEFTPGFYVGTSQDKLTNVQAEWLTPTSFFISLKHLQNHTEYMYRAYVSNGHNEVLSDLGYFLISYRDGEISLPYHSIDISPQMTEFAIEVGGSAEFTVSYSSKAYWLAYRREGRNCVFHADGNYEETSRSCKVSFRNLRNGQCDTLSVYQSGVNVKNGVYSSDEIVLQSGNAECTVKLQPEYELDQVIYERKPRGWLKKWFRFDYLNFSKFTGIVQENTSLHERRAQLCFDVEGQRQYLDVVQRPWDGVIRFEDPLVRKACLGSFDLDGDGEITFYEVSQMPDDALDALDFSGKDIKSFDEFRFFSNVVWIKKPVFAGSRLESIVFPSNMQFLFGGVFKDCTMLKDIELNSIRVSDEAFMGCTGLKSVHAFIGGDGAFEGCTGLETAVQQYSGIAPRTFKGCTALNHVEFSVGETSDNYMDSTIGVEAFCGCVSLQEMSVTEYVTEIHDKAFYGCSSLRTLKMSSSSPPSLGEDVFTGTHPDLKIYVPAESVNLYKTDWPSMAGCIVGY